MQIRRVKHAEWSAAAHLLVRLRPEWEAVSLLHVREELEAGGYQLLGLFDPELVAVLGWRPLRTLARGRHGAIEDLVVAPEARGLGYGSILLESVEHAARTHECAALHASAPPELADFLAIAAFAPDPAGGFSKLLTSSPGSARDQAPSAPSRRRA